MEAALSATTSAGYSMEIEQELGLTYHPNVESLVKVCDVVTINAPLHPETS